MTSAPLLTLNNIEKSYRNIDGSLAARVLENVNLSIGFGETLAITGPSGCGKSTLLKICGTLLIPDSGEVKYRGEDTGLWKPQEIRRFRNRNLGFIFQDHRLLPQLTLLENILLPLQAGNVSRSRWEEYRQRAGELLEKVGLGGLSGRFPGQVSIGESQRAAAARAMLLEPDLLLADEPTGALDEENAGMMTELLRSLAKAEQTAVLLVTHSPAMADSMDRRLELKQLQHNGGAE